MKLESINCPNCNSLLEVEDDLDMFFCKYCGAKVILDNKERLKAKERIRRYQRDENIKKLDNDVKNREIEYKERVEVLKEQNKRRKQFLNSFPEIILCVMTFMILGGWGLYYLVGKIKEDNEDKRVQALYDVATEYYFEGKYESALQVANQIKYNADISESKAGDWKRSKATLIDSINKEIGKKPELIQVAEKASYYEWKNYKDVEYEFQRMGFRNIITERENGDSLGTMLMKADLVYEISIDGDMSFKKGAEFYDNAMVVIRYTD